MGFTLNASLRVGLTGRNFPKFSKWRFLGRFPVQILVQFSGRGGLAGAWRRFLVRGGSHRAKEIKCYWADFVFISASGLSCTWKMLPKLLLMIFYKTVWQTLVV